MTVFTGVQADGFTQVGSQQSDYTLGAASFGKAQGKNFLTELI